MGSERGQASTEWIAVVLCVALGLGGLAAGAGRVDGRSYGGWLAHSIACAVTRGCKVEHDALAAAYGSDAELVRRFAPGLVYEPGTDTLPVDFRDCRSHRCSDAPDDRDLDAHRSTRGGHPATVFTHVVHRGGETFIQYWLYYPDSTSTVANAAGIWAAARRLAHRGRMRRYPGFHEDDWESVQVRVGRDGRARTRASSHQGYQWCKQSRCRNEWGRWTGWSRVSRGSHAGHVPPRPERERTSTAPGLRLVPIESVDHRGYRPLDPDVSPPWEKRVFTDPLSDSTS